MVSPEELTEPKTSLVKKHLEDDSIIRIECSPKTEVVHIYSSILRQLNVIIRSETVEGTADEIIAQTGGKVKVGIPFLIGAEIKGNIEASNKTDKSTEYKYVNYDLNQAQDVYEILKQMDFHKIVVLENFHYLNEEVQKTISFDLRNFQDYGVKFIVLGIWRERNRLTQYNGDLQDRIIEIPVEPWEDSDMRKVIETGSKLLNVDFQEIADEIIESSFDSIGVMQELAKQSCLAAGVHEAQSNLVKLTAENLQSAKATKLADYSTRHTRALEALSDSPKKTRGNEVPLFIPYYFVRVLLTSDFDKIVSGFRKKDLQTEIKKIHHRSEDVRMSDLEYFLSSIVKTQLQKDIRPPLFDYDKSINTLKIIDSTLYFFLRNCNKQEILETINPPSDKLAFAAS